MMKVLLVTFSDNADHQDITFGMFESMYAAKDAEVETWVMGIKTPKVSVVDTPHTKLVDCPRRPGIEKKTFDVFELGRIIKWINRQHFDVIFFETLHVWNLVIILCCHGKTRIFQMIHDLIPHEGDKQAKMVHFMNKIVCKLVDQIVLCNRKYMSQVTSVYGVPAERVSYVDMWRRFPVYSEPRFTGHVLFFGRMNPYKGIDNLLEIAQMCPDIQFDVVGRIDPQVEKLAAQLRALPNVSMKSGYVSDEEMAESFVNADWVVLPYNSATQSGVVIDSYRYGRPVIAFSVGAIAEQIEDGVSGFLIEAGNNHAVAAKLCDVMRMDHEHYSEISRSAYSFGSKKYAADGAVERFKHLVSRK